ncbi:hypothetical protein TTHERM_00532860 (macronuclear) [Tetrahymena thermophila SB210]|uniref:Transmembrane protein n=1 Tax=Tetrahymena thermophila (strain SB210) TaxID=312017 RepID=Q247Y3_TETTS|nr:hypothetical protein TTHERM_00532860 [Tetrahymena thermophila SB210]EAS04162.1 hypothetical protein TTHERM_00532860 [Tetrahymena thermophila SB210]|eukprot:XP_001024407.1 hypothetical protein TTHERM_00532860 [Tetrahymena thermophila SB210]
MRQIVLLIFSFALSLADTCFNDCATCDSQNVCLSCSGDNEIVNSYQTACICQNNYYATELDPIVCKPMAVDQASDQCEQEINLNVANFDIIVNSFYLTQENPANDSQQNYVVFQIKIDSEHSQFNSYNCRSYLYTYIQYSPSNLNGSDEDSNYTMLIPVLNNEQSYVSQLIGGQQGDQNIQIPLNDIYTLAHVQQISDDNSQIVQQMWFRVLIGSEHTIFRSHRWITYIFTNRDQVQFFNSNVDTKSTQGCQPGMNCIIIPDLDVTGNEYQSDWTTLVNDKIYIIGDYLYLRIWFKDSTYKKQLSFNKIFFLNDQGQIFDYSSLVDKSQTQWNNTDNSLHIMIQLVEPSISAQIQVEMFIQTTPSGLLRQLTQKGQIISQQFSLHISKSNSKTSNSNSQNPYSYSKPFLLTLPLIQLIVLLLFL